jgi:hypothetical protein
VVRILLTRQLHHVICGLCEIAACNCGAASMTAAARSR